MANVPKDLYLKIGDFADHRTFLNMLLANKNITEKDFKIMMYRHYPFLADKKPDELSWKDYYLETVLYVAKLMEEFKFPYIPHPDFDPKSVYNSTIVRSVYGPQYLWDLGFELAAATGNVALLDYIVRNQSNYVNYYVLFRALESAAAKGNLEMYKYLEGVQFYDSSGTKRRVRVSDRILALNKAISVGRHEMIKYIITTDPWLSSPIAFTTILNSVTDIKTLEFLGALYGIDITDRF